MAQDEHDIFEKLEDVGKEFIELVEERDRACFKMNNELGIAKDELEKANKVIGERDETIKRLERDIEILEDYKARVQRFVKEE